MLSKAILAAMGDIDDEIIQRAKATQKAHSREWTKWGALAACLCLVVFTGLFAANAYAANNSKELLNVDTIPPDGLTLAIVDASPDDAEFLITNGTAFQVIYGKANRVEKFNGTDWVEVTTESVGIFPSTSVTIKPGQRMYGMCGWVSKRLILDAGTYRYLLVVEVQNEDHGTYPVVLKAEFEIT